MDIKAIFDRAENGTITFEQFEALAKENGAKFADLSEGKYVSKSKYDSDINGKDEQIKTLNGTIATRDTDLAAIQKQLEGAGADSTKLKNVTAELTALQGKYDEDTKSYQNKLAHQAYEFAVKEYANGKDFTSSAAKKMFIQAMVDKNLQVENEKIMGADDFFTAYKSENEDSFVNKQEPTTPPAGPKFVAPTASKQEPTSTFNFDFTGVRPRDVK